MNKSDLKSGMLIKFKNYDELYLVLSDHYSGAMKAVTLTGFVNLNGWKNNLDYTIDHSRDIWDIVEVHEGRSAAPFKSKKLLWKRPNVDIELTVRVNGKTVDPSTLSAETWANLRKEKN